MTIYNITEKSFEFGKLQNNLPTPSEAPTNSESITTFAPNFRPPSSYQASTLFAAPFPAQITPAKSASPFPTPRPTRTLKPILGPVPPAIKITGCGSTSTPLIVVYVVLSVAFCIAIWWSLRWLYRRRNAQQQQAGQPQEREPQDRERQELEPQEREQEEREQEPQPQVEPRPEIKNPLSLQETDLDFVDYFNPLSLSPPKSTRSLKLDY